MRKLNTSDVFRVCRLIKKGNMKEDFKSFFEQGKNKEKNVEETKEEIGFNVMFTIIEKIGNSEIEKEVYEWLADITGEEPTEIKNKDLSEFINIILEIKNENDLASFFKPVLQLMKK